MRKRPTYLLLAMGAVGALWAANTQLGTKVPRYVFLNQTADRSLDKAFQLSLRAAEERSRIQNALILLEKIPPGETVESLATKYFQQYRVGERTGGRGLLYLYAQAEQQMKIEVSYALEGTFPDALCRRLEASARTYMLSGQKREFIADLMITMNIHAAGGSAAAAEETLDFAPATPAATLSRYLSGGAGVVGRGYAATLDAIRREVLRAPAEERERYLPDANPEKTASRYLASLHAGVGDPSLPLLTEGSSYFRTEVPRNEAYLKRVARYYDKALPFRIAREGSIAYAIFQRGVPERPLVLRKNEQGLWLVDEAKAWAYFHRYENSWDPWPKYDDMPLAKQLTGRFVFPGKVETPRPPEYPFSLALLVQQAENRIAQTPSDAAAYFALGDLLYFETYWLGAAIALYEKGLSLAPTRADYRWRLVDLYLNDNQIDAFLAQLKAIKELRPNDEDARRWSAHYEKVYDFSQ